ncbi:MAG: SCO family protein [Proteobacteria bacterium]|nr:SCO family protein [Pseudomonadota bacterium]
MRWTLRNGIGVLLAATLLCMAWRAGDVIAARAGVGQGRPAVAGMLWPVQPELAPFALQDARGGRFDEAALRGRWTLLFLGYTHCPDVCPTTLDTLAKASAALRDFAPFAAYGQVLFVSVDHDRDHGESLRRYVEYFNPAFRAASAPPAELHGLLRQLDMQAVRISSDDSPDYAFEHSSEVVLVGPDLKVLALFDYPHEPADIAARVRAIVAFAARPR